MYFQNIFQYLIEYNSRIVTMQFSTSITYNKLIDTQRRSVEFNVIFPSATYFLAGSVTAAEQIVTQFKQIFFLRHLSLFSVPTRTVVTRSCYSEPLWSIQVAAVFAGIEENATDISSKEKRQIKKIESLRRLVTIIIIFSRQS